MPPLYIKLEFIKKFVKDFTKHFLNSFKFLYKKLIKGSQVKLEKGIFVDLQIWEVLKDPEFEKFLNTLELRAWHALNQLAQTFEKISSHFHIKKVLQSCLRYLKK